MIAKNTNIYSFKVKTIDKEEITLERFKGKILLIVNVASCCGFTKQYAGLENLYQRYRDKGLEILGFPCNQFGGQEPGDEEKIKQFCDLNYHITFPLFAKIEVNGRNAHPLYVFLKENGKGILGTEKIKWNFTKFLVNKKGEVVHRFAPVTTPEELESAILKILEE